MDFDIFIGWKFGELGHYGKIDFNWSGVRSTEVGAKIKVIIGDLSHQSIDIDRLDERKEEKKKKKKKYRKKRTRMYIN